MVPEGIVRRPQLTEILAHKRGAALALIVAPPGYGKSTLLAEWAERDDRPFVWLKSAVAQPEDLVASVRKVESDFVLVLDDAHLVAPAVLRQAVGAALDELPAGCTLALASRTEPALPTGRLRAHRLLVEVRTQQLAMGSGEASMLLRNSGLDLSEEDVRGLAHHAEGWPAALYLAALSIETERDGLTAFGGQHHLLVEYLRDEVLAFLSPEVVTFAVHTSVLAELSGPICDAVLKRSGSARMLERLARETPLLVAVDSAHFAYRWHTLMRETLQAELRRIEPALEPELRIRASGWYADRGDSRRAIEQCAAAGDAGLTGDLLWHNILAYLTFGRNDLVREWLGNFTGDQIAAYPPLAVSAAMSALLSGEVTECHRWSVAASAALEREHGRFGAKSLRTGLAVIEAAMALDGVRQMGEVALGAAKRQPKDSLWRPLCMFLGGVASYLQGDRPRAELLLENGSRLAGNSAPAISVLCLAERAMIALEREEWDLTAELTDRAAMIVEEWGLHSDPLTAIVFAAAAASRARAGRIDEAKRDLRCGIDLLAALGDFVPWYGAQARVLLAHASLWLADAVAARTLLAEASRFARRTNEAAIFAEWFDRAWAYMDTLAEASLGGPSSLTIAELRILRFLPSHRSFREIAAQLGVSANTVKTQAHAVYRKLGAASRSEAVAQAMEAGLLGQ